MSLRRVLGVPSLIIFGLAYMAPLTIFTTYGVVTSETLGHLPVAYAFTLIAMFFTAVSYGSMVKEYPSAGSAYSYTFRAFGSTTGFMVGWTLLLDYIFLPLINFLLMGLYLSSYFPIIPSYVFTLAAIIIITGLNILGIKLATRMNFAIIGFQTIFLMIFLAMCFWRVFQPDAPSLLSPFYSEHMQINPIIAGAAVLCLSFLGFDAISTLSEEARDPTRTVPRAIVLCTLIAGILFIITAWAGHMAFPDWRSFKDLDTAANELILNICGEYIFIFFAAAFVSSGFASALASQISVSRILYSMGRDKTLPNSVFGKISAKYGTPIGATLVVGFISLLSLVISLTLVINIISFGALVAFSFVNIAVIKIFIFDKKRRQLHELIIYGVMPLIGFLFTLWLWTSLSFITFVIGLCWFAIGFIYLTYRTNFFKVELKKMDMEETV
ncbi:APC family permease (plasmid) [Bartonella sp. HY329]|uniref:APC family permease n=1 Tax=unclassified Bartonella TaxID=2645622 RepID=UPI0021CAB872|nr:MULTISPECIES: APC family permease [unclassified Bartonella]UXM96579.1 APC family permease [Bartonella sp. HY329]UXN10902.1 APC family permease [Bartonella sp. HY328]